MATALAPAVPAVVLLAGLVPATANAADTVEKAACVTTAVLAIKDDPGGIPPELAFLEAQLKEDEFAVYKSFQLIEQKEISIRREHVSELKFSSGNRIGLTLMGNDDKRLKIQISLTGRDGAKQLLSSQLSFNDGAVVMVRAGDYEAGDTKGKLFFAVQCARI